MKRARGLSFVLGVAAAAFVLLPLAGGVEGREGAPAVTVPDRLAGYSYLTASLSDAPSGRALALYQHGFGVELMDYPQAVVLAADDDVYRRLDAAEDRGGAQTQGDPGPMLLSPDGRRVALGDHDTKAPDLGVVDLGTGEVSRLALPDARSVLPIAWSPDGSQVAYLSGGEPTNPHSGSGRLVGDLVVLDLGSGTATPLPGTGETSTAAFSPDGQQLAVQDAGTGGLSIIDLDKATGRTVPTGDGRLAGPAAWSPDGSLLAVSGPSGLRFVDPAGSDRPSPVSLALDSPTRTQVLGWTGDREVAILAKPSDADVARVIAHPLDGSASRELTRIGNQSSFGVDRLQLASALLPEVEARSAGDPDRGPLPAAFRIALATAVGFAMAALVALVARRRRSD